METKNHKNQVIFKTVLMLAGILLLASCLNLSKHKALIIAKDPHIREALYAILENTNQFRMDVTVPDKEVDVIPDFFRYDLVVLSGKNSGWSEETNQAFMDYVKAGGGVVFHHSSPDAFTVWPAFTEMTGLSAWGCSEKDATNLVFVKDPRERVKTPFTGALKTEIHAFVIEITEKDHPITNGMPRKWMHPEDVLFNYLSGPGNNLKLLATAYSDTSFKGSGRFEPVLFTNTFGKGRIFHTTLGHSGTGSKTSSLHCAGFITSLQRGAEWAATGSVTQEMPVDAPNSVSTMLWPNYRPYTLDELFNGAANFTFGKSRQFLSDISERVRTAGSRGEKLSMYEDKMIAFLNSEATPESKNYIMQELSWMGSDACIPSLKKLMEDKTTEEMASFALKRLNTQ